MVLVKPHVKLAFGGTIGTPALEVWTNSLNFTGVTDGDSESYTRDGLAAMIPEILTVLTAWFTQPTMYINHNAHMSWIKLNKIGTDGKYIDNPLTVEFAQISGGFAVDNVPWQQSMVVSLRTGAQRGRGSKGRIYPPLCGSAPGADGRVSEAFRSSMQGYCVTLIGDLNKILGPDHLTVVGTKAKWNACIVSNGVNGKLPLLTPITHLYVDGIPDVQRRRVNRVPVLVPASTPVYINT